MYNVTVGWVRQEEGAVGVEAAGGGGGVQHHAGPELEPDRLKVKVRYRWGNIKSLVLCDSSHICSNCCPHPGGRLSEYWTWGAPRHTCPPSSSSEVGRHYYLDHCGPPWRARSCLATSAPCPPSSSTWPPALDISAHYSCCTFAPLVMRSSELLTIQSLHNEPSPGVINCQEELESPGRRTVLASVRNRSPSPRCLWSSITTYNRNWIRIEKNSLFTICFFSRQFNLIQWRFWLKP